MDPIVYRWDYRAIYPIDEFPGYDGVFADLWAAAIILYSLLTGKFTLYNQPLASDWVYGFYLLKRGLFPPPSATERAVAWQRVLAGANRNERAYVVRRDTVQGLETLHNNIPPSAMSLLSQLLETSPWRRISLAQAIASSFVQDGP